MRYLDLPPGQSPPERSALSKLVAPSIGPKALFDAEATKARMPASEAKA
jgi:hypothetical protein